MTTYSPAETRAISPINYVAYAVVVVVWAAIGLICWIPLLFRATATVAAGILYHAFANSDGSGLSRGFDAAVSFYPRGFVLVRNAFVEEYHAASPTGPSQSAEALLGVFLRELIWTLIFWGGVVLGVSRLFAPDPAIPSIGAYVDDVSFFESGDTVPPEYSRVYRTAFDSAATRYVNMRLHFTHPVLHAQPSFPITCHYVFPDGSDHVGTLPYQPQPDSSGGEFLFGFGWKNGGEFARGDYSINCSLGGKSFLHRKFQIE